MFFNRPKKSEYFTKKMTGIHHTHLALYIDLYLHKVHMQMLLIIAHHCKRKLGEKILSTIIIIATSSMW